MAAQLLSGYGFEKVYNLKGGIQAWNGLTAEGPEEWNLDMIRGDETPAEIIALAYGMERSLGEFYRSVQARTGDKELADLLGTLAGVEDRHKEALTRLAEELLPGELNASILDARTSAERMEGGFTADGLMRNNEKYLASASAMLDLSMMLETQALDLYLRFAGKSTNDAARTILFKIGDEEKAHLAALGRLRNERV